MKVFTKERVIYALILALSGLVGTIYTARSQAASAVEAKIEIVRDGLQLQINTNTQNIAVTQEAIRTIKESQLETRNDIKELLKRTR